MDSGLTLELLTPEKKQTIKGITSLTVQLTDGFIGILPGHAPLLAQTVAGPLAYQTENGKEERIALEPGILVVDSGKATIFIAGVLAEVHQLPARLISEGLALLARSEVPNGKKG